MKLAEPCATLRQTTLRLLRHFVESFCRITSSSKSNFVECIFVEYDTSSNFSSQSQKVKSLNARINRIAQDYENRPLFSNAM